MRSSDMTPFFVRRDDGLMPHEIAHGDCRPTAGLGFIKADYTLTLSRLPAGLYIGLAAEVPGPAQT